MSYQTIGSSNLVTNGNPLELEIVISRKSLQKIHITGFFSIENLENIASSEELKKMTCILYGKTDDTRTKVTSPVEIRKFSYDRNKPGRRSYIFRNYREQFKYLILKIRNAKCTIQSLTTELKIKFHDKSDPDNPAVPVEIPFTVQNVKSKPEILSFSSSLLVLQGNEKPITLNWKVKGESYEYILREGIDDDDLYSKNGKGTVSDSFKIDPVPIGDHNYTLEVKQGDVSVTKTIQVRALDISKYSFKANLDTIANICVSQNSNYLFSLILKTENGVSGQIDSIGYTNEGFSGEWARFELIEEDKEKIKPFATSPMVHLKDVNDVYGRLFFIGGSYVKPMECFNAVAIVNLDEEDENSRVRIIDNLPWASRMGHSCEVFPHGSDTNKIWLLGGVDEWGGSLNDIWVSGNGKDWNNIDKDGVVNTRPSLPVQIPWEARCFTGTSIELDDEGSKKELWIGGGFSEIGGRETADIWKWNKSTWNKSTWTKVEPLVVNDSTYLSSGMCFLGKDELRSTGMYLFGGYTDGTSNKEYFYKIKKNDSRYTATSMNNLEGSGVLPTTENQYIITAYFKGCLWFIVLTNEGNMGITYTKLLYWVPIVTERTLILT